MFRRIICCGVIGISLCLVNARHVAADDAVAVEYDTYDQAVRGATSFYRDDNFAACKAPLEAALELASSDEKRVDVHLMLINTYAESGEYEKMCESTEFAIEHAAGRSRIFLLHPDAATTLARAAGRKGQVRFVRKRCQDMLAESPDYTTALVILAMLAESVDRDPALQADYQQQLLDAYERQKQPADAKLVGALAQAYARATEPTKAAPLFERAAKLDDRQKSYFLMQAAKAWSDADDTEHALAAAAEATKAGPDDRSKILEYFWNRGLGEVYLAAKQKPEAIEHLTKALELTDIQGYKDDTQKLLDQAGRLGE